MKHPIPHSRNNNRKYSQYISYNRFINNGGNTYTRNQHRSRSADRPNMWTDNNYMMICFDRLHQDFRVSHCNIPKYSERIRNKLPIYKQERIQNQSRKFSTNLIEEIFSINDPREIFVAKYVDGTIKSTKSLNNPDNTQKHLDNEHEDTNST